MNKKELSWALYDWANSVFFTTVVAGFFPIFFKKYWSTEASVLESTSRLGIILGVSGFLIAVSSPLLGILSDYRQLKKKFLFIYTIFGALSTMGLYFVPQGDWFSAAILYGVAMFFCSASMVYYDALLVSVTTPERYDRVSSYGYSLGYLGGGLLFVLNILMFQNPDWFGFPDGSYGVRFSFLTVGLWWFVFTMPLMWNVPEPDLSVNDRLGFIDLVLRSIKDLNKTFLNIFKNKNLFYFILAYWFYIDGVGTVITMAVDFGVSLGFDSSSLIKALLLTQFVGFPAAYFAGRLSNIWSSKKIILGCIVFYIGIVMGASVMNQPLHFYILAGCVGLAQGGIQALSRSFFAQLIPKELAGEYFGFFNLLGKFAAIFGPLLMAFTAQVVDQPQKTILSLLVLFVLGFVFLVQVKIPQKIKRG